MKKIRKKQIKILLEKKIHKKKNNKNVFSFEMVKYGVGE